MIVLHDDELMELASHDPRAFDELYVRHAEDVHRWLRAQTRSDDEALELTAEVFAQAWAGRRRYRRHPDGSAAPWLYGIARNLVRQSHRRRRVARSAVERLGIQLGAEQPGIEDDEVERIADRQLGPDVTRSLAALPRGQRDAITLRVLDELPYDAIAERLACTVESVRMRVTRGLRTLASDLST